MTLFALPLSLPCDKTLCLSNFWIVVDRVEDTSETLEMTQLLIVRRCQAQVGLVEGDTTHSTIANFLLVAISYYNHHSELAWAPVGPIAPDLICTFLEPWVNLVVAHLGQNKLQSAWFPHARPWRQPLDDDISVRRKIHRNFKSILTNEQDICSIV